MHRRQHIALRGVGGTGVQHGRQGGDVGPHQAGGAAGGVDIGGHHQCHHLAHVLHAAAGQNGFVVRKAGQHRVAGNVGSGQHGHHTGQGQRGAGVQPVQGAVGHGREHGRGMQRAGGFGDVVHIRGRALHLGGGAFVRRVAAHGLAVCGAGFGCGWGDVGGVHAAAPVSWARSACSRLMGPMPVLSAQARCSRLPSTVRR